MDRTTFYLTQNCKDGFKLFRKQLQFNLNREMYFILAYCNKTRNTKVVVFGIRAFAQLN